MAELLTDQGVNCLGRFTIQLGKLPFHLTLEIPIRSFRGYV